MKSFVATSTAAEAVAAGKEVAAKVAAGIDGAKVAMAYGSCDYDAKALLGAIAEGLPGVPVLGNTSFTGIITPEGFVGGDDPFVGILALGGDDVVIGTAGAARDTAECARCIGKKLAEEAMKAAGIGWLKRKAMKAALAVAPSSEKGTYVVKGQQVIMTDSNGEKDTLMLSQDGQYLSGKMDKDTPFKLKRKK